MPTIPRPGVPHRTDRRPRGRVAPWIPDVDRSSAVVDCAVYRAGVRQPGTPSWQDAMADVRGAAGAFVWIGLHEPTGRQLAGLADRYGLHPLAVEDAIHAHQRPKLEQYDDMLFAVVKTVHYAETPVPGGETGEVVETGEVMVFLGTDYVITVRHGEHSGLTGMRRALEAQPDYLAQGPSVVLHAIVDRVVDEYLLVAQSLTDDVDEIEASVFSSSSRVVTTDRMYLLKREVMALRRAAAPLSAALQLLATTPVKQINDDITEYFRDVDDHLATVVEQIGSADDLLTTLVQANLARISVQQNEDMRKISAWVAIAAVPTMVAGIYGMNFKHMPELSWMYGYPLIIGGLVLACSVMYRAFRHNGWL